MAAQQQRIIDLSVLIGEDFPAGWPTHMPFQRKPFNWYAESGPDGAPFHVSGTGPYYTEWLLIDEHTGTHFDAPAHFLRDRAQVTGAHTGDEVDLGVFYGECAVIDASGVSEGAGPGVSPVIPPEIIEAWEREHGRLRAGEIVLFRTAWDRFYVAGDEGKRYAHDVLVSRTEPGWPAPEVPAMQLLLERGVRCAGTDAPSMGTAHNGAPVHVEGLSKGMVYVELLTNLDQLPPRGATFVFLPLKIQGSSGGPGRAIGIVGSA